MRLLSLSKNGDYLRIRRSIKEKVFTISPTIFISALAILGVLSDTYYPLLTPKTQSRHREHKEISQNVFSSIQAKHSRIHAFINEANIFSSNHTQKYLTSQRQETLQKRYNLLLEERTSFQSKLRLAPIPFQILYLR